jgi:DNA polymerase elongation subunit (family B)
MQNFNFFPFTWSYNDELVDDTIGFRNVIRVSGWNEKNESVQVVIQNFNIPIWLELPRHIEWTNMRKDVVINKIMSFNEYIRPQMCIFEEKHKLYYGEVTKVGDTYERKKFPYLCVAFKTLRALEEFKKEISKGVYFNMIGNIKMKCHCHERSITPVLKLMAFRKLPSSGWITAKGHKVSEDEKDSTKMHEYICSYKNLKKIEDTSSLPIVYPKVLSFDLEAYSSVETAMPNSKKPADKVFQIGCCILEQTAKEKKYTKYLLSLGELNPIEGVSVLTFKTEDRLYKGFINLVKETNPDVIIGYNIFGWDIGYMNDRMACLYGINFDGMSCVPSKKATINEINWESSAYGKQDLKYIEAEGRMFIDLLPYIKRNYKLSNYRLETVCSEFLKDSNKDPLKAKDIFNCYKKFTPVSLSLVGKYCCKDAEVTLQVYEKLLIWFDLVESATTNGVPIIYLYTKGQQIKMYSQLLTYCVHNNIVVESNAYTPKETDRYTGAYVSQPIAGLYKTIIPFDFASLYPSIIMAYNIDYSKLVIDENIPDEDCHVFEWEEEQEDLEEQLRLLEEKKEKEKEVTDEKPKRVKKVIPMMKVKHKFRFLKIDRSGKGVVPTLLENLIKARKSTRKIIEENQKRIEESKDEEEIKKLEELNLVLDKRQLAYKVSANSMYGAMGVKKGYLPFPQAAMCVTYVGRQSIHKASNFLETECGGKVIYNDTDSAYTYFECLKGKPMREIWEYVENVVKKVEVLFPKPMKLEFEGKVYTKFLILTKKRYVAQMADINGNVSSKLVKRGIVLQRRDNCQFLRDVYQNTVNDLLERIDMFTDIKTKENKQKDPAVCSLLNNIIYNIDELFQMKYSYKSFVITKSLTKLPEDYKSKTIPVHAYLAAKMKKRGIMVQIGSRIEYLLLDRGRGYDKNELQQEKVEDVTYFSEFRDVLRLDYLYYLRSQVVKPIDELLSVCLGVEKFLDTQLKLRIQKSNFNIFFKNSIKKINLE